MKRPSLHSRATRSSGFTLVELLVVMGIIAILAGVLFPMISSAISAAKRAKASATANQIQTSVLAYYTEYSVYPVPTTATTDQLIGDTSSTDGASWATLDCVLCGNVHPSDGTAFTPSASGPTNTRAIAFLNLKSSDVFASGATGVKDAPKNPLPTSPSANIYFNIAIDGVLGVTPSAVTLPNFAAVTNNAAPPTGGTTSAGVAVWANCNGSPTSQNSNFWVKTY